MSAYWICLYKAVHDAEGYQAALRALGDGAERDLRVVPGAEGPAS